MAGAVDVRAPEASGKRPNLTLVRTSISDPAKRDVVREVLLSQGTDLLRYCSPERLAPYCRNKAPASSRPSGATSTASTPCCGSGSSAPSRTISGTFDMADGASILERCARLRDELRRTLRVTTGLPSGMSELLLSMLNEDVEDRPTAGMVAARLTERDA